jgi:hypothetical protein
MADTLKLIAQLPGSTFSAASSENLASTSTKILSSSEAIYRSPTFVTGGPGLGWPGTATSHPRGPGVGRPPKPATQGAWGAAPASG